MDNLINDIATATAEMGMQMLANWLPADLHSELRETLHDLAVGACAALRDAGRWRVPAPSKN